MRAVSQSRVREQGGIGVLHLVKALSFSVLIVSRDTFYAGSAWLKAITESTCVADTIKSHVHIVKKNVQSPRQHPLSSGFQTRFLTGAVY